MVDSITIVSYNSNHFLWWIFPTENVMLTLTFGLSLFEWAISILTIKTLFYRFNYSNHHTGDSLQMNVENHFFGFYELFYV